MSKSKRGLSGSPGYQDTTRQMETSDSRQADADLRHVMSDPIGRRFVWKIVGGVFTSSTAYVGDPNLAVFNDGKRAVCAALMSDVQTAAPDLYVQMLVERLAKESETKVHKAAAAEAAVAEEEA